MVQSLHLVWCSLQEVRSDSLKLSHLQLFLFNPAVPRRWHLYPGWIKKKRGQSSEVRVFRCWTLRRETVLKVNCFTAILETETLMKKDHMCLPYLLEWEREVYTRSPLMKKNHVMIAGTWSKNTNCRRNLSISLTRQTTAWFSWGRGGGGS